MTRHHAYSSRGPLALRDMPARSTARPSCRHPTGRVAWLDPRRVCLSWAAAIMVGASVLALRAGEPVTTNDSLAASVLPSTTNAPRPARPEEVNIALRRATDLVESPNLLSPAAAEAAAQRQACQTQLELGWQQKQEKEFARAEKTFVALLATDAPADFHRTALLELALLAQEQKQFARAQQVFAQYVQKYPDDPSVQEVLLRQGLLYRQMGASMLALAKFYSVMTTSLRLKLDRMEYYQRLVLQAQTEIAETYYLLGKFEEASDFLGRLLKLDHPQLNKGQIQYKLVRSQFLLGRHAAVLAQAEVFLRQYPAANEVPEVRFLLATALKKLGRNHEAMQQVLALLESQQAAGEGSPETRVYWQQRTGNEIGNELYREGDYVNALEVYRNLAGLHPSTAWQVPVWYQTGLVYERLQQPRMASETYTRILDRQNKLGAASGAASGAEPPTRSEATAQSEKPSPSLLEIFEMARWRKDHLSWQVRAQEATARLVAPAPQDSSSLGSQVSSLGSNGRQTPDARRQTPDVKLQTE